MSVFSLKLDISDNRYFNGKHSPLFSREEAHKALKFHEKIRVTIRHHCMT